MIKIVITTPQKDSLKTTLRKVVTLNDCIKNNRFHVLSLDEDNQNDNEELHLSEISPKALHSSKPQNSPSKESVTEKNEGHRPAKNKKCKKKTPADGYFI